MKKSVFLSASVPDLARTPQYHDCDPMAVRDAVIALTIETQKRNIPLIFGGHPSITAFLARWADRTQMKSSAILYQSRFFEAFFSPEINAIPNLRLIARIDGGKEANLTHFRNVMIAENDIGLGVFMGGMEGLSEEKEILIRHHPDAIMMPMRHLGGQTRKIFTRDSLDPRVAEAFSNYISPGGQFSYILDRLWIPDPKKPQ